LHSIIPEVGVGGLLLMRNVYAQRWNTRYTPMGAVLAENYVEDVIANPARIHDVSSEDLQSLDTAFSQRLAGIPKGESPIYRATLSNLRTLIKEETSRRRNKLYLL
jgi:hypothetical protein